jgi:hypothetical protein
MLHSQIIGSGLGWEDLLVGDEPEGEAETQDDSLPDEDDQDDRDDDITEGTVESDTSFTDDESKTLSLIEKLLARDGISSGLREELEGYKTDISDGEFQSDDHRYVHALYARLTKS